jgi:hypothetical protein
MLQYNFNCGSIPNHQEIVVFSGQGVSIGVSIEVYPKYQWQFNSSPAIFVVFGTVG